MKKLFIFICIILLFSGCFMEDPIETLIPPELLKGAISYIDVFDIEIQTRKSINGGTLINAWAAVPYNIKREQVKPTLLSVIRELKKQNPECEWFVVWLCADGERARDAGVHAGRGEYTKDQVNIGYWIPSQKQLKERLELKKQLADPALKNQQTDDLFALEYDPDYVPAKLLDKKDFDLAVKITILYYNLNKIITDQDIQASRKNKTWDSDLYRQLMVTQDGRALKMVADKLKIPEDEIRKRKSSLLRYYCMWDGETIKRK